MAYRLQLLGSFRIIDPPTISATTLNTKDKCVLAYLAINANKSIARETIRRLIWPDVEEKNGRHSLSQSIYALSKAFPSEIQSDRKDVRLSKAALSVDVELAKHYAAIGELAALENVVGGAFLADLSSGSSSFEDWKDAFNASFYREIEVRVDRATAFISPGMVQAAHDALISLASKLPEQTLLRRAEQLMFGRIAVTPAVPQAEITTEVEMPFLGRNKELGELQTLWTGVTRSQRGSLTIIEGDAGQGKSRLLNEFIKSCDAGFVIRAQCYEAEQHVPLNLAVDLVSKLVDGQFVNELPAIYRSALGQIFARLDSGSQIPKLSEAGAQRRLYESMLRLFIIAADHHPLLIVIDDVQWSDESTLAFLHFANRRLADARVLIVLAARPSSRIRSAFRNVQTTHIRLTELQASDVCNLYKGEQHPELEAARAMALTGGNAFLLTEHFKSGLRPGARRNRLLASHEVGVFVRGIIARLSREEKKLLAMLSAVGVPVKLKILYDLSESSSDAVDAQLRRLRKLRIVSGREVLAFRHDLIRERVYRMVPRSSRARYHARILNVLQHENASADALAFQAFRAGDKSAAFEYAVRAAQAAEHRSSLTEYVHYTELALRVAENRATKATLRYDLAAKLFRAGLFRKAIKHARLAARSRDLTPLELSKLLLAEIDALALLGRLNGADVEAELKRAEVKFGVSWPPEMQFQRLKVVVRAHSIDGRGSLCSDHRKQMALIARDVSLEQRALALSSTARAEAIGGSFQQAVIWAEESEVILEKHSGESPAEVKANLAAVYCMAGQYERAYNHFSQALALFQAAGDLHHFTRTGADMLAALVDIGKFDEARRLADEIHASWTEDDSFQVLATTHANLAIMQCDLAEYQNAQANAERAISFAERGAKGQLATIHALLGISKLESGFLSSARMHADWIASHEGHSGGRRVRNHPIVDCFMARWLVRNGETNAATKRLRDAVAHSAEQDFGGSLRLRLELARTMRHSDPQCAKVLTEQIKSAALVAGLIPLHDAATSLCKRF